MERRVIPQFNHASCTRDLLCVFIDTLYTDTLLVGTGIRSSAREDIDDARHN